MRRLIPLTLAAAGLALAGCASPAGKAPAQVIDLRLSDAHRRIQGTLGLRSALRVWLPAPLHPGTQWTILSNESRVLRQLTDFQPAPGGGATIEFLGIHDGRSVLRLAALDPAQTMVTQPDDLFLVAVEVSD